MLSLRRTWIERLALVVALLPLNVGLRFLLDPVHYATLGGISLQNAGAVATLRMSMGAFHLGIAFVAAMGLIFSTMRGPALVLLFTFMVPVLCVRLLGFALDGYYPSEIHGLLGETTVAIALAVGLTAYLRRPETVAAKLG